MTWRNDYLGNLSFVRQRTTKLELAYMTRSWDQPAVSSFYVGSLVVELDNLCVDALRSYAITVIRREQTRGLGIRRIGRRPLLDGEYGALALESLRPRQYAKTRPLQVARRDEPTVRNPVQIKQILTTAGVPAQIDFDNAIALNYGVFSQLKVPRHYYAHRNFATLSELLNEFGPLRLGPNRDPDEILHFQPGGSGTPQFLEWTAEVRTFFDVAVR